MRVPSSGSRKLHCTGSEAHLVHGHSGYAGLRDRYGSETLCFLLLCVCVCVCAVRVQVSIYKVAGAKKVAPGTTLVLLHLITTTYYISLIS